jgi:integrase
MAELAKRGGAAALALRFTILTAARTGMTIGAVWGWVDAHHKEWLIPGIRMKGDKDRPDFYVPLSTAALAVLDVVRLPDARPGDVIFPGDITVHGFRSSFRDWAALETTYKREVVEAALAHTNKDKTEAAYLRTDMLELRAALMEDWAEFLSRPFARDDRPARRSRH